MRQDGLFWAAAVACAAAFSAISGCGDNRPLASAAPDFGAPDAGAPSGAVDASQDGNAGDGGSPDGSSADGPAPPPALCDTAWHDLQIGTELDDQLWGMAADANGHLYVAGFEHGVTGVTNIEPDGDSRGVVIQIDLAGEVQWRTAFDTTASDTVEGIAVDPANGAVVAVGRTSGAFEGVVNQGQFDSFLAALDRQGRISGILQSGDERPQHPSRLSLGGSHLIAVAGFDDTYVTGHSVEAQEDGFVASFERGT